MTDDTPANEIMAATAEAGERRDGALRATSDKMKRWPLAKIGLGVGIGSAAIAGAVLFANRGKGDRHD
jgi:hypothetical protein